MLPGVLLASFFSDSFLLVVFCFCFGYCCIFCSEDDRTCWDVVVFTLRCVERRWLAGLVEAWMGVDVGKSAGMEVGNGMEYAGCRHKAATR